MIVDPVLAPIDAFRALPRRCREQFYASLEAGAIASAQHDWPLFARPDQLGPPLDDDFSILVFRGWRGTGKTEAAINYFSPEIFSGRARAPAIIVGTAKNDNEAIVKRIQDAAPPHLCPTFEASKGQAGALTYRGPLGPVHVPIFTASAPEAIVMNNFDLIYADDIAKWGPHAEACWNHARATCRVGYARIVVATTRRGTDLLRRLLSGDMRGVVVRSPPKGRWDVNRNINLAKFASAAADARGSRFGREEYDDEDTAGNSPFAPPVDFDLPPTRVLTIRRGDFDEIVVGVDESGGKGGDHDEWGIVAGAVRVDERGDRHVVGLEDASGEFDDDEAGEATLALCERWGATKIIVERNRGDRSLTVMKSAWNRRRAEGKQGKLLALPEIVGVVARDQKRLRAGELRPLYLAGLLHHGPGLLTLERQAREWDPDGPKRPRQDDRIDAWVHLVHYLARLSEVGDAWSALAPEATAAAAQVDPYRYQAPSNGGDGWSAADPYRYAPSSADPYR